MKKQLALLLACIMITICLSACDTTQKITTTSEDSDNLQSTKTTDIVETIETPKTQEVPKTSETPQITVTSEMPDDFAFSFSYAIGAPDIIDTYKGIIQKDLYYNETATAEYHISKEKLNEVYQRIISLKLYEITTNMTSVNLTKTNYIIDVSPLCKYTIIFTIKGKQYTVTGDNTAEEYIEENEQAAHFWEFTGYMVNFVENTDEYKSLPQAKDGYD